MRRTSPERAFVSGAPSDRSGELDRGGDALLARHLAHAFTAWLWRVRRRATRQGPHQMAFRSDACPVRVAN
jgi:hypothetical protein